MTIANLCILVACALPVACAALAKSKGFAERTYDNRNPRGFMAGLSGWRARANAAQANSFEALPLFIAGVLAAQQMQAPQGRTDALAMAFIALRLAYIGVYIAGKGTPRSAIWALGVACCAAMFF
ncbi:MAPEG family protein [Pelomonas sp. KK5]|uniref:MAPEG family protein n=1 Tax=Pelomonas sp. KK5 TaxID=1855730 RepID=UPI00097BC4AE|nr:MAPEG family protein [Pelomonas sp. KK5]